MFLGTLSEHSPLNNVGNSSQFSYSLPEFFPDLNTLLCTTGIRDKLMSPICRTVARISAMFYLRVSEVLNLKSSDIIHVDRLFVRGLKKSRSSLIYLPGISEQIMNFIAAEAKTILFPVSYRKCYTNYIRAGISLHRPGKKNTMRCHAPRYNISNLTSEGYNLLDLGDILKHRSSKSILYYLST